MIPPEEYALPYHDRTDIQPMVAFTRSSTPGFVHTSLATFGDGAVRLCTAEYTE